MRDLVLPTTVKVLTNPDDLVVRVTHIAAEEIEAPVAVAAVAATPTEPEVIKKGKIEEEEEAEEKEKK